MSDVDIKLSQQVGKAAAPENAIDNNQLVYLLRERRAIARKILKQEGLYSEKERMETLNLFEYVQTKIKTVLGL